MFTNKAVVILGVFGKHSHTITMQVYSRMGPIQKPTHRSIYVCMYVHTEPELVGYICTNKGPYIHKSAYYVYIICIVCMCVHTEFGHVHYIHTNIHRSIHTQECLPTYMYICMHIRTEFSLVHCIHTY